MPPSLLLRGTFYMYLIQLYKRNKWWFVVVVLFAFGQVFINYKNGVMCSPFYNYNMYSYPSLPHNWYSVVHISVNGRLLQPKDYSPHEWDNLIQPIIFFDKEKGWNSMIFHTEVQKLFPIHDSALYENNISERVFFDWYKKQVLRIAHVQDTNSVITIGRDTFVLAQQYLHTR